MGGYSLRLQRLTAVFGCSSSCSAGCGCICQHGARDSQVCRTILVFVTTAVPMTRRGSAGHGHYASPSVKCAFSGSLHSWLHSWARAVADADGAVLSPFWCRQYVSDYLQVTL